MGKLEQVTSTELKEVLADHLLQPWEKLSKKILDIYNLQEVWYTGGKLAQYELKLRKGTKTIVSMFPNGDIIYIMLIFGKIERERFESHRDYFSTYVNDTYDESKTFHDGKWVLFEYGKISEEEIIRGIDIKLNKLK